MVAAGVRAFSTEEGDDADARAAEMLETTLTPRVLVHLSASALASKRTMELVHQHGYEWEDARRFARTEAELLYGADVFME